MDLSQAKSKIVAAHIDEQGAILSNPTGGIDRVRKDGKGLYMVLFSERFLTMPAVIATQHFPGGNDFSHNGGSVLDNARVVAIDPFEIKIKVGDGYGNPSDRQFSFIATGLVSGEPGSQAPDYGATQERQVATDPQSRTQQQGSLFADEPRPDRRSEREQSSQTQTPTYSPFPSMGAAASEESATIVGNKAVTDAIGVVSIEGNRSYVFVKGADGNFWVNWWTGERWEWLQLGGPK